MLHYSGEEWLGLWVRRRGEVSGEAEGPILVVMEVWGWVPAKVLAPLSKGPEWQPTTQWQRLTPPLVAWWGLTVVPGMLVLNDGSKVYSRAEVVAPGAPGSEEVGRLLPRTGLSW